MADKLTRQDLVVDLIGLGVIALLGSPFVFSTLRLRNDIMCESVFCVIDRQTEIIAYFMSMVSLTLNCFRPSANFSTAGYWICSVCSTLLQVYQVHLINWSRIFWNAKVNTVYANWSGKILLLNVGLLLRNGRPTGQDFVTYLLVQMIFTKFIEKTGHELLKINVFKKNIGPKEFCIGLTLLERSIKEPNIADVNSDMRDVHLYYTGLWESNYEKIGYTNNCVIRKSSSHSKIHGMFVTMVREYKTKNLNVLKLKMKLEVVQTLAYLKNIRSTFEELKI